MPVYHVFIHTTIKGKDLFTTEFNYDEEHVRERITNPYMSNKSFMFAGTVINPSDINTIVVFESEKEYKLLVLPNGKSPVDEADGEYKLESFLRGKVEGISLVTPSFITSPPRETKQKTIKTHVKGKKVFIVHGRDETQALRLQKYLTKTLKIDADMFEDFKTITSSNTIIEQLEYIKNNVGYAFVVVTPDDLGCLREEINKCRTKMLIGKVNVTVKSVCEILDKFNTRSRQNVVFEHGLFIGALGRDNVCCLLQKNTKEKPSDIDGILYVGFSKSVKETFPEITEKLKAWQVKT